ncbi:MAG: hypothetical protein PHC34_10345 [Candidatus Gastranaerophilales bacterium]|nr:hypothetical protein [Candidatus Gastranaerophilales bacterium]
MVISSISNSSLNSFNKQKINFRSTNTNQYGVYKPTDSNNDNEEDKKKLKKTYWIGVLSGILFSVLSIGGDRLCEYLIKKNSPKIK